MIGAAPNKVIRLPYPHDGQKAVRREARRINILSAGRRWRKTTLLVSVAIEAAVAGKRILWGAPTFDQVRVAWGECRHSSGGVADFKQSTMVMTLPTKGAVIFRSLDDPDNARGHTVDGIVIDEAGDVKELAWYEVLRPMLIDTGGWAWLIGTPKGRNWFWREYVAAKDREDAISWQIPTLGCRIEDGRLIREPHPMENPNIPFMELEQMYQTTPETTFRQEILAEFIEGEGVVFRNIKACTNAPKNASPDDHKGHRVVAGLDWAKHLDFTATSILCADCRVELAKDRFNQIDYHFQRNRLKALYEKWHVTRIEGEANSIGEPNIEELKRDGLPIYGFQTTTLTKQPLIESLALAFEKAECQFIDDPMWTSELEAYEVKILPQTGRSSYSAPDGMHDDTVMARALAWYAVVGKWRSMGEFLKI
jgi:hypothetical protein